MKKIFLIIAALVSAVSVRADEGMWLLPMLQRFNADAMRNIGSRLTPEDIYSINSTSLKDAIVQFGGGCTGEIISPEGLLVTNHHCGYASIQQLSTTEHNYLEDGFFATSKEMEIPVPGLTVKFMRSMTDITDLIAPLSGKKKEKTIKEMEDAASAEIAGGVARVTSFYNDNVYYLIVYQIYKDVRFVAAPPAAMGKFGGETDNWMWPRHTCDFSMFRVYADENNNPAEYAAGNRPFVPKRFLKVSLSGVSEGDFALVMGYPGRTQRFQTAVQLKQMMACNGLRVEARTVLLIERAGRYAILKRPARGLLAGLWELPNIAGALTRKEAAALMKDAGFSVRSVRRLSDARHIFTHIEWALTGWHVRLAEDDDLAREERARYGPSPLPPLTWADGGELTDVYGIPAAFHHFLPDAAKKK